MGFSVLIPIVNGELALGMWRASICANTATVRLRANWSSRVGASDSGGETYGLTAMVILRPPCSGRYSARALAVDKSACFRSRRYV